MQNFQIHYYFSDETHSMNAFVRNKAEKELLELIKKLGEVIESQVYIETFAYEEGGLKEILAIGFFSTITFLSPSINDLITHYLITDEESQQLDKDIKKATLEGLQLDNEKKKKELEGQLNRALNDKKATRHASNFYSHLNNYKKVTQVGFRSIGKDNEEFVVPREKFESFILHDQKDVIEDDSAVIEVISPVLKEGRYKWRGVFNGEKIEFSMGDAGFKKEVVSRQHTFSNGTAIDCFLVITITYDEFGDEKKKAYSVKKVYGIRSASGQTLVVRKPGKKKFADNEQSSQTDLFD